MLSRKGKTSVFLSHCIIKQGVNNTGGRVAQTLHQNLGTMNCGQSQGNVDSFYPIIYTSPKRHACNWLYAKKGSMSINISQFKARDIHLICLVEQKKCFYFLWCQKQPYRCCYDDLSSKKNSKKLKLARLCFRFCQACALLFQILPSLRVVVSDFARLARCCFRFCLKLYD